MPPTLDDVLCKARSIWGRQRDKQRALQSEDLDFRAHFGCGPLIFLSLWNLLVTTDLLPSDGTIDHLLWTLLFMKTYAKQSVLCSMCGGVDPKTFQKWTWEFIAAISQLESLLVSSKPFIVSSSL